MKALTATRYIWSVNIVPAFLLILGFLAIIGIVNFGKENIYMLGFVGTLMGLALMEYASTSVDQIESVRLLPKLRKRYLPWFLPCIFIPMALYIFLPEEPKANLLVLLGSWAIANILVCFGGKYIYSFSEILRFSPIIIFLTWDATLSPLYFFPILLILVAILSVQYIYPRPWVSGVSEYYLAMQDPKGISSSFFVIPRRITKPHALGLYFKDLFYIYPIGLLAFVWVCVLIFEPLRHEMNPFSLGLIIMAGLGMNVANGLITKRETVSWYSLRPGRNTLKNLQVSMIKEVATFTAICFSASLTCALTWEHLYGQLLTKGIDELVGLFSITVMMWVVSNTLAWFSATFRYGFPFVLIVNILGYAVILFINLIAMVTGFTSRPFENIPHDVIAYISASIMGVWIVISVYYARKRLPSTAWA